MNKVRNILLAILLIEIIFAAQISWGHELNEGDPIATTCTEWTHATTSHRVDVADAVEFASHETAVLVQRSEKYPPDLAHSILLCVTDTENTDLFIDIVDSMCASRPDAGLDEAVIPVSANLFDFCILSSMMEHGYGTPSADETGI